MKVWLKFWSEPQEGRQWPPLGMSKYEKMCNFLINFSPHIGQMSLSLANLLTTDHDSEGESDLLPLSFKASDPSASPESKHFCPNWILSWYPPVTMLVITQLSSCTPAIFWNHFDVLYPGSDAIWAEYNYEPRHEQGLLHSTFYIQSLTSATRWSRGGYFKVKALLFSKLTVETSKIKGMAEHTSWTFFLCKKF